MKDKGSKQVNKMQVVYLIIIIMIIIYYLEMILISNSSQQVVVVKEIITKAISSLRINKIIKNRANYSIK